MYGYPIAASLALTVVLASTDRFLLAAFLDEAADAVFEQFAAALLQVWIWRVHHAAPSCSRKVCTARE